MSEEIPTQIKHENHIWVIDKRSKEDMLKERKEKIVTAVITGAIISFFTTCAGIAWYAFTAFVANGGVK